MRSVLLVLLVAAAGAAVALTYGITRWQVETRNLRARMNTARLPATLPVYRERELEGLPPLVQRYFRAVLRDGQPMIAVARFSTEGQLRRSETSESWAPFRATQMATVRPPGFDWDACIRWLPGVRMFVRDAYFARTGTLHAAAYGLFTLARKHGGDELAQGELMRYLAEALWYPTALLPSQGVRWQAIEEGSARAWLADGPVAVSLDFHFDAGGLVRSVRSEGRPRILDGALVPTPWEGRFSHYGERSGMRIPLQGEVAWETAAGRVLYWRGRITQISYELDSE